MGSYELTNFGADILDHAELLEEKKHTITRFIGVLVPILDLFQLCPNSVHIFYGCPGSPVTFNRNKSIFLNLRSYETLRMYCFLYPSQLYS